MSWAGITATAPVAELDDALHAAVHNYAVMIAANNPPLSDEALQQINSAVHAALLIAQEGEVTEYVTATLSGHANPGHTHQEGWGPDYISVTVSAVTPEHAVAAAAAELPPLAATVA